MPWPCSRSASPGPPPDVSGQTYKAGWDPVWFGVVITLNLAICTITPPIAVNLYVASNISGASMEEVSRWVLPFFLALMVVLLLVMFIPGLALWLPNVLGVR